MTEYELDSAVKAFERALEVGAPGIAAPTRAAIARSARIRLSQQFNVRAPVDAGAAMFAASVQSLNPKQ